MSDRPGRASNAERGVTRRRLLAAGAWSVPVVTVAAVAPAMAVSPPPGFLTIEPAACRYRNGGLALLLHVNNTSGSPRLVQVASLLFNTSARFIVGYQNSVDPVIPDCTFVTQGPPPSQQLSWFVAAGASKVVLYTGAGTPPTTGGVVTLQYSVPDLQLLGVTASATVTVAPQGEVTCALNDPTVNPCAPLVTGN